VIADRGSRTPVAAMSILLANARQVDSRGCVICRGTIPCRCSSPSPENVVGYEHFRFTCCANDLQQAWHTGDGIPLQWMAESAGSTSDPTGHLITLTAVLTGPYASVAVLKAGGPYTRSLAAQPRSVTDRMSGDPVSSIDLPLDLPVGWYNLVFTIKSAGGKVVSATVIQVTLLSP
jgi:hypothetical protein